MNYPLISEYVEAIKAAEDNFDQLKHLRPVLDDDGEPVMTSGNFAVVFKMKDEQTGKLYAVKCFLKEQEGRAEAYRQIAEELEYVSSTFLTPIKYLDKELFVDSANSEDSEFPVLLMDWVEGQTLDKYIREHIDDQYELSLLAYQFSRLAMWLMPQPFAHGDLKPDNILVKEDGTLVLVDYDGMYVPAMKGQKARELGSPDFRHPGRTEEVFDDHIDDFSLASILLSLKAIALQPSLLEEYGASDRLLFSEKDYRNLSESSALGALQPLMHDAELASLYSLYILALSQNNLSQVSFRLFNLSRPDKSQYEEENLSTEVTEEDLANAWTDEYGVMYSADRKRLLRAPRDINEYSVREGTKVICDGDISKTDISNKQNRRVITKIGEGAFYNCVALKSILFPRSLVKIGDGAFRCCKSLRNILIPDSVIEIGARAFCDCVSLEKCISPNSVSKIGDWTFRDCKHLKEIIIGNSVIEIGKYAFGGCQELCDITLPKSLLYIKDEAFRDCRSLSYIQIPPSAKMIGDSTFYGCENLKKIDIPKSLSYIGKRAFERCASLSDIIIPDLVKTIEFDTFSSCKSLTQINIPNSVSVISDYAFSDCEALSSIDIPNSVTIIGNGAFSNCCSLSRIFIPDSVWKIGDYAFSKCESLCIINIPDSVSEIGTNPFFKCERIEIDCNSSINGVLYSSDFTRLISYLAKGNSSFVIPDSVLDIDNSAFYGIGSLTQIIIPNSVKRIGRDAFRGCWNLKTITIPKSVQIIEDAAFYHCEKLAEVVISNSDLHIDKWAFKFCNSKLLIKIPFRTKEKFEKMLPASFIDKLVEQDEEDNLSTEVTDEDLANAWTDEFGVKYSADRKRLLDAPEDLEVYSIIIGTKVICKKAFAFSQIKTISFPETILYIGSEAFSYTNLMSVNIPRSTVLIDDEAFAGNPDLVSIFIPQRVVKIGQRVLSGCYSLTSIVVEEGNSIYDSRNNCNAIIEVETNTLISGCKNTFIPDDEPIGIGNGAFQDCGIQFVSIPDSVTFIGRNAFRYNPIKSIKFPNELRILGAFCFSSTHLQEVAIPDGVTWIESQAFSCCLNLEKVFIPNSVSMIGGAIFYNWPKLKSICVPKNTRKKFEELLSAYKNIIVEQ